MQMEFSILMESCTISSLWHLKEWAAKLCILRLITSICLSIYMCIQSSVVYHDQQCFADCYATNLFIFISFPIYNFIYSIGNYMSFFAAKLISNVFPPITANTDICCFVRILSIAGTKQVKVFTQACLEISVP